MKNENVNTVLAVMTTTWFSQRRIHIMLEAAWHPTSPASRLLLVSGFLALQPLAPAIGGRNEAFYLEAARILRSIPFSGDAVRLCRRRLPDRTRAGIRFGRC